MTFSFLLFCARNERWKSQRLCLKTIKWDQLKEIAYNKAFGEIERLKTSIVLTKLELTHLAREKKMHFLCIW